ncbi:MAG: putative RNA uridine N3 methyltransferase [Candidatus Hodarchaeales archaeon]|jgi:predicted SPOUT superfamily RNA methylase MTH1
MNHIIAIPDSAVIDCSDLRTKTEKIFQIARIAAIFQVKDILVYHDPFLNPSRADRERRVLTRILKYIECPQYLRKRFFPLSRDTAAVGVLSPLATPHHPRSKELKTNEIREAAIFLNQNRAVAEVGGINLLELVNPPKKSLRERVLRFTVIIREEKGKFLAEILPKPPNDKYWGYSVHSSSSALLPLVARIKEFLN